MVVPSSRVSATMRGLPLRLGISMVLASTSGHASGLSTFAASMRLSSVVAGGGRLAFAMGVEGAVGADAKADADAAVDVVVVVVVVVEVEVEVGGGAPIAGALTAAGAAGAA